MPFTDGIKPNNSYHVEDKNLMHCNWEIVQNCDGGHSLTILNQIETSVREETLSTENYKMKNIVPTVWFDLDAYN